MAEWIRFGVTAVLLLGGILAFATAMIGNYRFGYVLNRMHGAGIGDTLGLFLVVVSLSISAANGMDVLKMALLVVFCWCTSPVSSHFLSRIEMGGDREYLRHLRIPGGSPRGGGREADRKEGEPAEGQPEGESEGS